MMAYEFDEAQIERQIKEEEIKRLIPEGERKVKVMHCEQKQGSFGDYFQIDLKDEQADKEARFFINLSPKAHYIFKAACNCFDIMDKYSTGKVEAEDFIAKAGMVRIEHFEKEGRGMTCKIAEYMEKGTGLVDDEDLPF